MAGADRIALTEQIAVMDLIALGRFVLLREDDLNLAALLRSPLCGLSEEELFALCHGREGTLWQRAGERRRGEFRRRRMSSCREMLERADYAPPFEFYSHALTALGKQARSCSRGWARKPPTRSRNSSPWRWPMSAATRRRWKVSCDWVERGGTEIKRDMERGRDEVRVMTVHGAKGLEADIVILPDTTALPEPPCAQGPSAVSRMTACCFPLPDAEAPQSGEARPSAAAKAETLQRASPPALCRADPRQDRLYVCGFENKRGVQRRLLVRAGANAAAETLGVDARRGDDAHRVFGHVDERNAAPRSAAPAQ